MEQFIKEFYVVSEGDSSVGIPKAEWTVSGGFFFSFQSDIDAFKGALRQAFADFVSDDVYVETFEERQEWLRREEEQWANQSPNPENNHQ